MPTLDQAAACETAVVRAAELPDAVGTGDWAYVSSSVAPSRLASAARDPRWDTRFVVASTPGRPATPVGLLSVHRCQMNAFPAAMYDPAVVAPGIFPTVGSPAGRYLLIGGNTELVAGGAVDAGLDAAAASQILAAMVRAAFDLAAAEGLIGAALYVREEQVGGFLAGSGGRAEQVEQLAVIDVLPQEAYIAGLSRKRRATVRRDLRRLDELRLHAVEVAPADVLAEAAPLVAAVKQRYGLVDHPRLAQMRLADWAAEPVGHRLAFAVRDAGGDLLAVTFGCHRDDVLEIQGVGLDDYGWRHLAYAEVMAYAPLRYAHRVGCARIDLGLGASQPKDRRGARFSPVWAVGVPREWRSDG